MNMTKYRIKQSTLEFQTNMALIFNLVLMLTMAAVLSIANSGFTDRNRASYTYLFEDASGTSTIAFEAFFSFYLILNSFIPAELPVVIEISKMITTYFMQNDASLCQINTQFREIDKLRVNNMNLHEELANIDYIFCDKTGTLTQNELVFKKLSIVLSQEAEGKTQIFEATNGDSSEMAK